MITLKNHAGTDVNYSLNRHNGDSATYIGPEKSDIVVDTLLLSSKSPARVGSSYGNRRSGFNIQRSTIVPTPTETNESKVAKFEFISSIPAGMTESSFNELIARAKAALDNDAIMKALFTTGQMQF